MVFSSIQFFIYFSALLLLLSVTKDQRVKKGLLLGASLFFYSYWDIRFVPLLFLLACVNYFAGYLIEIDSSGPERRKLILGLSIAINLMVLGYFKYTNFFIDNLQNRNRI